VDASDATSDPGAQQATGAPRQDDAGSSRGFGAYLRSSWPWLLVVFVILTVSAVLRFWDLGKQSLWFDELFTQNTTAYGPNIALKIAMSDTNPPLYYLLQLIFLPVRGRTEWSLRALSAFVGVLSTLAIYLAGRKLFDRPTGAWAAALFVVSTLGLFYAQEARMYSLLILFAALTLWAFGMLLEKPTILRAVLLGVVLAGLAYTHVYGYMAAPMLLIPVLLLPRLRHRVGKLMLVTYPIALVLFLPWALVVPRQIQIVRGQVAAGTWWMRPPVHILGALLTNLKAFSPGQDAFSAMIFIGLIVCAIILLPPTKPSAAEKEPSSAVDSAGEEGASAAPSAPAEPTPPSEPATDERGVREGDLIWTLLTLAILPMLVGLLISKYLTPVATTRNSLVCLPAAYILAARGGVKLPRWVGLGALAALLVLGAIAVPFYFANNIKDDWRDATLMIISAPRDKAGVLTQEWEADFDLETYAKFLKGGGWLHALWVNKPKATPPLGHSLDNPTERDIVKWAQNWDTIYVVSMDKPSSVADYMNELPGWKLTQDLSGGRPVIRVFTKTPTSTIAP